MTTRKIQFTEGEFYHIYNRGTDKRIIFKNNTDYFRFMLLLYFCNSDNSLRISSLLDQKLSLAKLFSKDRGNQLVDIGAFTLMPNHFHILIKEKIEGGISTFMGKLATAYVMYFNTKYERKGSLFEGPFGAKHIDTDEYLNWVFSYIHLNPVKLIDPDWKENGISDPKLAENFMQNYKYSSYYDYFIEGRPESTILTKDIFSENLSQLNDFKELVIEFESTNQLQG
jgi:putative transposase